MNTPSPAKLFETKYGYFDGDGWAFNITRPDTPKPWANVLANPEFGTIVSQAGGGFTWIDHSALSVLTRWKMDLVRDDWGKWLYIKDEEAGDLWSAAPRPVSDKVEGYLCRHEIGATIFKRTHDHIETEWTITVPPKGTLELWWLKIKNNGPTRRKLTVASAFAWCLGANPDNHREFHRLFIGSQFDQDNARIVAKKCLWEVPTEKQGHWNTNYSYTAFHNVWVPGHGTDGLDVKACGDLEKFLGRLGNWESPAWLINQDRQSGGFGRHGDDIASLACTLELDPGEEKVIAFSIGAVRGEEILEDPSLPFRETDSMEKTLHAVRQSWKDRLDQVRVETPEPAFDILTNIWLPYQALSARLWGRTGYWQQSGAFGFRDQLQDSHVYLPSHPEGCAAQIRLHARHQFADGTVYHWWHPLSEVGLPTKMTDDLLWLPFVATSYIKETGDWKLLDLEEPFIDDEAAASIWEHGRRAIEMVLSRFSPRGLPLIGEGDWNDGLSAAGREMKGESIWLGHFLYGILKDWAEIARRRGDDNQAASWLASAEKLHQAIEEYAWDGNWYIRATLDDGTPLGSSTCEQGKIFLNAQTWAIINGVGTRERQETAWSEVEKTLLREHGPLLFLPAYDTPDARVGYLTRYAPGTRENGGVYTHAATWAILAACRMGRGSQALDIYRKLAPPLKSLAPDDYAVEPYVLPGNINGPDSPLFGQGGWTWYTGSASWLRRIAQTHIIGMEPDWDGLRLSPCLPPDWDKVTMKRPYRGDILHITITNTEGLEGGEPTIFVDGKEMNAGNLLQASGKGLTRKVEIAFRAPVKA